MLIPPWLLHLRMGKFGFWFPVFLCWPILGLFEAFLLPVALVVGLMMMLRNPRRGIFVMHLLPRLMAVLAATRGLQLKVQTSKGPTFEISLL